MRTIMLILLASISAHADEWQTAHAEWRALRAEEIAGPEGWMTLVGMQWLEHGDHSIGSDEGNDIVLNQGPARLGILRINESGHRFEVESGESTLIDGMAVESGELLVDIRGSEPTVISVGSLRLFLVERGGLALRVRDLDTPYRLAFVEAPAFDLNDSWRISARFEPNPPGQTIDYLDARGFTRTSPNPGRVMFDREGSQHVLEAVKDGERLFLIFADKTNGRETYGAGRFLYASWPENGQVELDFNRAHNPPCVYSEYANCPLPPAGNRLRLAVTAGEMTPKDH